MEAVLTAAEHVSKERDQLLQMVWLTLPLHFTHAQYPQNRLCMLILENTHFTRLKNVDDKGGKNTLVQM